MAEQEVDLGKKGHFKVKKGAFRAYLMRKYGKAAFESDGTIKHSYIERLSHESGHVGAMARTAKGFSKMSHS
jgi:hypothetical protein